MPITGKPVTLRYSGQTLFFIGQLERFDYAAFESWYKAYFTVGFKDVMTYLEDRDRGTRFKQNEEAARAGGKRA